MQRRAALEMIRCGNQPPLLESGGKPPHSKFAAMTAIEGIEEGIEVYSHFRQGMVSPVWFVWHGRLYRVQAITHRWVTREGQWRHHHFAVVTKESLDLYELRLHSETMDWFLVRICMEG